jgi:GNAT superfamily N-acetyltransferase
MPFLSMMGSRVWGGASPTAELGIVRYRRDYAKAARESPDWRITCFFVARRCRGRGVAATALDGALTAIARSGGGRVESYPEEFTGRAVEKSLPYMYNGLADMFERRGFERIGRLGKNHWLMTKAVTPEALWV